MTDQVHNTSELLAPEKANRFTPTWFAENVMNPAINAGPLGVYNTAADLVNLPTLHLKTDDAKPYSPEWFAQGISSGVGATVPFMIMSAATGSLMGAADRKLAGTSLGAALNPYLTSEKVATIAGASIYGALQRPDADHTRLGNAIGTGAGLAVFAYGNDMVKDMPMLQKAMTYPLIGFVGGGTMTEVSQLASNLKFARNDQALQGAVQGMTMNTVMGLTSDYLSKRIHDDQAAAAEKAAEAQKASTKAALESTFDSKNVKMEQLSPETRAAFDKVREIEKEYREFLKDNKTQYPKPEEFDALTANDMAAMGFYGDEPSFQMLEAARKKGKGGGHGPRPLPDARIVAEEVGKVMKDMPDAMKTGDIKIGEWNMEFLTADKARYFKDAYNEIIPKHHLVFVEETNEAGLAQVAKDNGYNYVVSRDNGSGQAVGFLVNPRLEVKGTTSIESVANVHDISGLRPAFKVDLHDTATGNEFSAVVIHLKSMRGGEDTTGPVRLEQARVLARDLGPDFHGVIAGDWNTFLDTSKDLNPLKAAGFQISNANDHTATQSMGGRLDGFVTKGLPGTLAEETINPFFKNPLITRGLSDHALLTTTLSFGK
jgi:hypothetical protein